MPFAGDSLPGVESDGPTQGPSRLSGSWHSLWLGTMKPAKHSSEKWFSGAAFSHPSREELLSPLPFPSRHSKM